MGVEFTCGLTDWRNSYSGLQEQRALWIRATIEYLKNLKFVGDEESDKSAFESQQNSLQQSLKRALQPTMLISLAHVNYAEFEKVDKDALRFFGLIGLYSFVSHSDCEGSYCPGEAVEMLETFKKIASFMKLNEDYVEHYNAFVSVMKESISTGKNVELH